MRTEIFHFETTGINKHALYTTWDFCKYYNTSNFVIPPNRQVLLMPCDNTTKHDYTKCYQSLTFQNLLLTFCIENISDNNLFVNKHLSLRNVISLESTLDTGIGYINLCDYQKDCDSLVEHYFQSMCI